MPHEIFQKLFWVTCNITLGCNGKMYLGCNTYAVLKSEKHYLDILKWKKGIILSQ